MASRRKPFRCAECGKTMSRRSAEYAVFGPHGCPRCGSACIDLELIAADQPRQREACR